MAGEPGRAKAALTFEDMLILFMRRLVGPVAASGLAIGTGLFAIYALLGTISPGDFGLIFFIFFPATAVSAVGLAVVGIPAGYLVARRGYDYGTSMALLGAIGFAAGLIFPFLLGIWTPAALYASIVSAPCGALVATIWTAINADLFRGSESA